MATRADIRRRWIGAALLAVALAMLIAGETVLRERMSAVTLVVFWVTCFAFTLLALLIAVIDLAILRRRMRAEHRALFQETLDEIARQKQVKSRKPGEAPRA